MNQKLSDAQIPSNMPSVDKMRRAMLESFSPDQLELIGAWLGLESIEAGSEEIFQCGRRLLSYSDLVSSGAYGEMRSGDRTSKQHEPTQEGFSR